MSKNLACRVFAEQINLIKQLPENERATVLYGAIMNAFNKCGYQNDNQTDNQIGNQVGYQNEYAYISVSGYESLSSISKCVLDLLSKNIVCKEFSENYGGRREGAGSKKDKPNNPSGKNQYTEKKETPPPVVEDNSLFEEFWKLYTPIVSRDGRFVSKGNKKSCLARFNKILKEGIEYATIINGLKNYLNYCTENGVCSCGAEVFLNQRRWENDYSRTGTVQSNQSGGVHRQNLDIVEAARQFAEDSQTDL